MSNRKCIIQSAIGEYCLYFISNGMYKCVLGYGGLEGIQWDCDVKLTCKWLGSSLFPLCLIILLIMFLIINLFYRSRLHYSHIIFQLIMLHSQLIISHYICIAINSFLFLMVHDKKKIRFLMQMQPGKCNKFWQKYIQSKFENLIREAFSECT